MEPRLSPPSLFDLEKEEEENTTTPAGRLMFTMIAAFAEVERSMLRERVKLGMAAARARKNTQPMYLHRSLQPLVQINFATTPEPAKQSWLGFSRECLGVCGV